MQNNCKGFSCEWIFMLRKWFFGRQMGVTGDLANHSTRKKIEQSEINSSLFLPSSSNSLKFNNLMIVVEIFP